MKLQITIVITWFCSIASIGQPLKAELDKTFLITVINPTSTPRENVVVFLSKDQIAKKTADFNKNAFVIVDGKSEIPSQYNQHDKKEGILFVLDNVKANETRNITVKYKDKGVLLRNYPKRTQAELSHKVGGKFVNREYIGGVFKNVDFLRVPPEHKDHSWFIRYEGPGWESDKIGYRFYLDQRNATDVFGKTTSAMVLQNVGQDGFDSYHELQPWGMDVMKVGKSLGLGSIGAVVNGRVTRVEKTDSVSCRILENGNVYSSIFTHYAGWEIGGKKIDLKSLISIHAGTRLSKQELVIDGLYDSLCTGIVKDKTAKVFTSRGDATHWGYLATYGKQSLNTDELGLVVFFDPANVLSFQEDEASHIVVLKPNHGRLQYYFEGAWIKEVDGIKDENDFLSYLTNISLQLSTPLQVTLTK